MHEQFRRRVEGAQYDMESDPSHGEPAGPVAGAQDVRSTDDCAETDERDPNDRVVKRTLRLELDEMRNEPDCAGGEVENRDEEDGEWAFFHGATGLV